MSVSITEFFEQKIWAVIGVSSNPAKYGHKIYNQLKNSGYIVYAINPNLSSIDGEVCYPSLNALPNKPDAVSVVVPPKATEQVIKDCIDLGITRVWMQPGAESEEAIRNGEEHGISVIHNQCVLIQQMNRAN